MSFNKTKEIATSISNDVVKESTDVAKLNVGKLIYGNVRILLKAYLPQPKWYTKLLVSQEKREVAELMAVYGLLHLLKTRYSHYLIDAVTSYINFELQNKLIGAVTLKELDEIFKLPTKVE